MPSAINLDFYYWCTPNGDKVLILLEELGIPYTLKPINILRGDQHKDEFLRISPNNKIPAIELWSKDVEEQEHLTLFESGAILLHLAERYDVFIDQEKKSEIIQWLFWQVGGLGPMAGQTHHFNLYAPEPIPYAKNRYEQETHRLYQVLEKQLENREYIVENYSIADMACYPWINAYANQGIKIKDFPNIQSWMNRMSQREAVIKTHKINQNFSNTDSFDESARNFMFGDNR